MNARTKILLTTSRNPTPKIRTFCNDLARVFPSTLRVNRGKMSLDEVAEKALEIDAERVVIVDRWQSGTCKIEFFYLVADGLTSVPPILFVADVRLQREIAQSRLEPNHSMVITQPASDSTQLADSLARFFDIAVMPEKEAESNFQAAIHISRNAKGRVQMTFIQLPQKLEIGPRITVGRVEWEKAK